MPRGPVLRFPLMTPRLYHSPTCPARPLPKTQSYGDIHAETVAEAAFVTVYIYVNVFIGARGGCLCILGTPCGFRYACCLGP